LPVRCRYGAQFLNFIPKYPILAHRHTVKIRPSHKRNRGRTVWLIPKALRPKPQYHVRVARQIQAQREFISRVITAPKTIQRAMEQAGMRSIRRSHTGAEVTRSRRKPMRFEVSRFKSIVERQRDDFENSQIDRAR